LEASVTSAEVVTIAVAVLVPIVTAILGVLGIAFQDWRQRRSDAGRRRLAFEDAGRQVSFATEWWNARKLLVDSPEAMKEATSRAVGWLEEASALVVEAKKVSIKEKPPLTLRRLLLFYPLKGRAANILRGVFFVSLAVMVEGVGSTITDALLHPELVRDDVGVLISTALLSLGLRFFVEITKDRGPEDDRAHRRTIRHWLLFYQFHQRTAKIVRIIFYAFLVGIAVVFWDSLSDAPTESGNLGKIPVRVSAVIALSGLAVGLHYWAVSLEMSHKNGRADHAPSSEDTKTEPHASRSEMTPVPTDGSRDG
jgi:hypothetical protein